MNLAPVVQGWFILLSTDLDRFFSTNESSLSANRRSHSAALSNKREIFCCQAQQPVYHRLKTVVRYCAVSTLMTGSTGVTMETRFEDVIVIGISTDLETPGLDTQKELC